jgi:hypothetical protein
MLILPAFCETLIFITGESVGVDNVYGLDLALDLAIEKEL